MHVCVQHLYETRIHKATPTMYIVKSKSQMSDQYHVYIYAYLYTYININIYLFK